MAANEREPGNIGNIGYDNFFSPRMSGAPRGWTSQSTCERLEDRGVEFVISPPVGEDDEAVRRLVAEGVINVWRADSLPPQARPRR
jgi:hypothetical protein